MNETANEKTSKLKNILLWMLYSLFISTIIFVLIIISYLTSPPIGLIYFWGVLILSMALFIYAIKRDKQKLAYFCIFIISTYVCFFIILINPHFMGRFLEFLTSTAILIPFIILINLLVKKVKQQIATYKKLICYIFIIIFSIIFIKGISSNLPLLTVSDEEYYTRLLPSRIGDYKPTENINTSSSKD